MSDSPEDRDLLAGIYVLGVLDLEECRTVEDMARLDPAMAEAIEAWQNRLAPLATLVTPVAPPPILWPRIATSLGIEAAPHPLPAALGLVQADPSGQTALSGQAARRPSVAGRVWRSTGFWRGSTAAALAIAAGIAAFALFQPPPPPRFTAALAPLHAPGAAFIAETESDGALLVRPIAPVSVQPGKDLELWALAPGAKVPRPLGVLPAIGKRVTGLKLAADTQIMISLEPQGGSPTGLPTGPVLWAGTLGKL
ncbi:MAG: anti-sigma factor [Rhodospirillales bacterium]|nr:anti-sigma factor [Rhodospirillales bacterium]